VTPGDGRVRPPVSPGNAGPVAPGFARERPGAATLPDPLPEFVEAAGRLAAAAVARGERAEARRLLEGALRALETAGTGTQLLRIVGGSE
jgi:hypothetical protein